MMGTGFKLLRFVALFCTLQTAEAVCPNGWVRHNAACYHFSHDTEAWANAVAMCHMMHGKLVEIETAAENAFLAGVAMNLQKNYWIALSDIQEEGNWIWMESEVSLTEIGFRHWNSGQPDNSDHNQNCATLNGHYNDGHWTDWYCKDAANYICEKKDEESQIVG